MNDGHPNKMLTNDTTKTTRHRHERLEVTNRPNSTDTGQKNNWHCLKGTTAKNGQETPI